MWSTRLRSTNKIRHKIKQREWEFVPESFAIILS